MEKYRIHDGMGIRTAVFLKGCHLRCPWCCNPESQSTSGQMAIFRNMCVSCLLCQQVCRQQAVYLDANGLVSTDMSKCDGCGCCVSMCPRSARKLYGKDMTLDEIMKEFRKDAAYYSRSGGGVTISGGEPLLQWKAVGELIDECHKEMFSVSIETCGLIDTEIFASTALKADELLIDVKTTDHRKVNVLFGKEADGEYHLNRLKYNIAQGVKAGKKVVIRCPIIPGFNYEEAHIEGVLKWATETGCKRVDLLPFHQYGKVKYQSLDMKYELGELKGIENQALEQFKEILTAGGIECTIGG